MTNSHIRLRAKELVASLNNRYLLVLFPLIINCYLIIDNGYRLANDRSTTFFHSLLVFISEVSLLAVSYNLLQVYRRRKNDVNFEDGLTTFASPYLFRFFLLQLAKWVILWLWYILGAFLIIIMSFILAVIFVPLLDAKLPSSSVETISLVIAYIEVIVVLLGLFINRTIAYSQAEFLLCEKIEQGQKVSSFALLKESKQLMKGYKWQYFRLQLSFIGWWLLMPFTLGLIGLIAYPYFSAANAIFYQTIGSEKKQSH